jgi:hypothetical protein
VGTTDLGGPGEARGWTATFEAYHADLRTAAAGRLAPGTRLLERLLTPVDLQLGDVRTGIRVTTEGTCCR